MKYCIHFAPRISFWLAEKMRENARSRAFLTIVQDIHTILPSYPQDVDNY